MFEKRTTTVQNKLTQTCKKITAAIIQSFYDIEKNKSHFLIIKQLNTTNVKKYTTIQNITNSQHTHNKYDCRFT